MNVGKTVCKMQNIVFPTVFYIWKLLFICWGGYHSPASNGTDYIL